MSTLLRSARSFNPDSRRLRPSEQDGSCLERPRAILRDIDAPDSRAKSNSNSFKGHLRAGALSWEPAPWQVRATVLITLLGPPIASITLLPIYYLEYWRTAPFNFAECLVVFFLFAVPVGYVLGAVPALLAASLYCALLSAHSRLQRRLFTRGSVGAICGGLASWVWFCEWLGASGIYGSVGALVMAILSLGSPRPGAKQLTAREITSDRPVSRPG